MVKIKNTKQTRFDIVMNILVTILLLAAIMFFANLFGMSSYKIAGTEYTSGYWFIGIKVMSGLTILALTTLLVVAIIFTLKELRR